MGHDFWNFTGSILELLSLVLLLRLLSADYGNNRRRLFLAVLITGFTVVATDRFPVLVGYFLNYGTLLLGLTIALRRKFLRVAVEFCLGMTTLGLSQFLIIAAMKQMGWNPIASLDPGILYMSIPLLLLCLLVGNNKKFRLRCSVFYDKYRGEIGIVAINFFLIYQIELYMWDAEQTLWHQNTHIILAALLLWVVVNGLLLKNLIENGKQKELLRIHDQHMSKANRFFDELLAEKHEFHRHLQFISGSMETEAPEKAIAMIQQYIEDINETGKEKAEKTKLILTCNDDLNALLYSEQKQWEKSGVSIFCIADLQFTLPFQRYEFVEVVGNLIRNGCEHAAHMPEEKRKVSLEIGRGENGSYIAVRNKLADPEEGIDPSGFAKKGFSTKEGSGRGYGLYNVKCMAEKYGGKLEAVLEDDCLCMKVLLP